MKASQAQKDAVNRYDQANTVQFKLKLNIRTDADIIGFLRYQVPNKQGYIKMLLRSGMWEAYNSCEDPRQQTRVFPSRARAHKERE